MRETINTLRFYHRFGHRLDDQGLTQAANSLMQKPDACLRVWDMSEVTHITASEIGVNALASVIALRGISRDKVVGANAMGQAVFRCVARGAELADMRCDPVFVNAA